MVLGSAQFRGDVNLVAMIVQQPDADFDGQSPWVFPIDPRELLPNAIPNRLGDAMKIEVCGDQRPGHHSLRWAQQILVVFQEVSLCVIDLSARQSDSSRRITNGHSAAGLTTVAHPKRSSLNLRR